MARPLVLAAGTALVACIAVVALQRVGGGTAGSAGEPVSRSSAQSTRLEASIGTGVAPRVRFSAVLNERTLKWQLTNRAPLASASVATGVARIALCRSCKRHELGTLELSQAAATAASTGRATLRVETRSGALVTLGVRAAPCSCAAGLYFPTSSPVQ